MVRGALLASLVLVWGCADELAQDGPDIPARTGAFTHDVGEDGVVTTVVDASDPDVWQHLDLDSGLAVTATEGWDLAFKRFLIRTNGGVSGDGGVQVAALNGQTFESVTQAPETGWTTDVPDGEIDDDDAPDNPFNNGTEDWYTYDEATHVLTARTDITYVVATTGRKFFKVHVMDYYDEAGSPAIVRFRWAEVAPPEGMLPDAGMGGMFDAGTGVDAGMVFIPDDAIHVDASGSDWVYLSATDGIVTPADPTTDTGWDLAVVRADMRTNSGPSGSGLGGARLDDRGITFADITEAGTLGYVEDHMRVGPMPGRPETTVNPILDGAFDPTDAWYDYDEATHRVTPGDRSYLIRTGTGGYAKLRVWQWRDGLFDLTLTPVTRTVETVQIDVDAAAASAWVYVDLAMGETGTVTEPAAELSWDLGLSETRLKTNGGTSGTGDGAAVETTATAIADLGMAPMAGFVVDQSLMERPPGSSTYDGNPALAAWYDYDAMSGAVTPRAAVFAVRTADGDVAKVQVLSYAAGVYRLAVAYAGPGHTDF